MHNWPTITILLGGFIVFTPLHLLALKYASEHYNRLLAWVNWFFLLSLIIIGIPLLWLNYVWAPFVILAIVCLQVPLASLIKRKQHRSCS